MNQPQTRVFVVEDEALIQMEIRDRLTRLGYAVCGVAARGETAIGQIAETAPDVVLMDINLAGQIDGIETANRVRDAGDIPLIFLSAYSDDELLRQAVQAGPYGYLVKPFDERELHTTIQAALAKHRALRTLQEQNSRLDERIRERTALLESSEQRIRSLLTADQIERSHFSAAILSKLSDPAWLKDTESRYLAVNEAWCRFARRRREEVIGKTDFDLVPAELATLFQEADREAMARAKPYQSEQLLNDGLGGVQWFDTIITALRNEEGEVVGTSGLARDITARKEIERELFEYRHVLSTIMATTRQGFWFVDNDTVTIDVNPALCAILGRPREEIIGKDIYAFVDEANAAIFRREIEKRRTGHNDPYEIALTRADGTLVPCINTPSLLYDQNGKKTGSVGIWTDITERKQAERALAEANASLERRVAERTAALAESERFNRGVLDAIGAHLAVLDSDGRIVATNAAWRRFAAANGLDWQKAGDGDNYLAVCDRATGDSVADAHAIAAGIRDVIAGRRTEFAHEYPCRGPNEQRWFLCRVSRFSADAPVRVVVAHDNVTAVHEALERATAGEKAFAALGEVAPVAIFRADTERRTIAANARWFEITGVGKEEVPGDGWMRMVHPDDRTGLIAVRGSASRDRTPFAHEYRFLRADGSVVWVIGQTAEIVSAEGAVTGYVGTLTDITERKQVELAMQAVSTDLIALDGEAYYRHVAKRLAEILDCGAAFISRLDPARPGELTMVAMVEDGAFVPNYSYAVAGTPCAEVVKGRANIVARGVRQRYPADAYLVEKAFEAYAGEPLIDQSGRVLGHLGVMCRKPLPEGGAVARVVTIFGIAVAAAMMRERNRRQYRDLFEFAPDALVLSDRQGRIVLANRQAEEIFGWSRAEMVGQPVEMLVPQAARTGHVGLRKNFMHSPENRRMAAERPGLVALRKDGTEFPVEIDLAPVETEDGVMIAAAVRDITARRSLEAQLAQATKMEAIGNLTGGMAHDFNNYLGIIIGNLDLLREMSESDSERTKLIDAALSGAERGAELTQSLLAFSRRQPLDPRPTDLNRRIDSVAGLLKRTLGEDIEFGTSLAAGLWPARVDAAQLDSCIVNLATNARDAMPRGGTLTIATRNVRLDEQYARMNPDATAGEYALIEVSETRRGMAPEVVAKVFEPFFSTKGPGHGTGLGLSMTYGFVRQSGGHIKIYSEPGYGTTVRIYLPRVDADGAAARPAADAGAGRKLGGQETILVVEDNEEVRKTALAQLASLGYRVIEAADGTVALEILERRDPPVDLVFTDVVMPGTLDGYALATLALERWPGIKVLLTSGFPGDTLRRNGKHGAELPLLGKPYRKEQLAHAIRTALDGETRPNQ